MLFVNSYNKDIKTKRSEYVLDVQRDRVFRVEGDRLFRVEREPEPESETEPVPDREPQLYRYGSYPSTREYNIEQVRFPYEIFDRNDYWLRAGYRYRDASVGTSDIDPEPLLILAPGL